MEKAIQDLYPESYRFCYGCGEENPQGIRIKSFWDGKRKARALYTPEKYHLAFPGYVYGGFLASLFDCHSIATAIVDAYVKEDREVGTKPTIKYVTASLHLDYIQPTPLGPELEIQAWVEESNDKKTIINGTIGIGEMITVKGVVVAVKIPEGLADD